MNRSRGYRWLAVLPPLAILVGVPLVNGSHAYVMGLPLLLFWIVACILFTSATLGTIALLDQRHAERAQGEPFERESE